jgi:addiction module RelE/StbE family toxin
MNVDFTKSFNKQFRKLPLKKQLAARDSIALFLQSPSDIKLRSHSLKGEWNGFYSISAGGDLRLHYKLIDTTKVLFVAIGSHSQLYK